MAVQDENGVVTSTAYEGEQASSPSEDTEPAEADAADAQEPVFTPIWLDKNGEPIVDKTGFPIQIELEPEQNASEEAEPAEPSPAAAEVETEDSAPADRDGDAATPSTAYEGEQAGSPSENTEPAEVAPAASEAETVDAASGPDPYDYVVDDPSAAGVITKEFLQSQQFFNDFAPKSEGIYVGEQSLSDIVGDMVSALTSANKTHPRYSFDDTGIAYLFADSYKWKLRYVSEMKV